MNRRNLMLFAAIAAAGSGILVAGKHYVSAANVTSSTSLSQSIAQKLNVSASDVQSAITSYQDTQQANREADRRQKYADTLTQDVTDGKITADQKTKLLTEYDSVQSKMSALQTQEQQVQTDAQTWATTNGIDTQYLPKLGGRGPGGPM